MYRALALGFEDWTRSGTMRGLPRRPIAAPASTSLWNAGRARRARRSSTPALRGVLRSLIILFVAKSLERIGDHASNIFEHVIYAVRGDNLRHSAPFSSP